MSQVSIIITAHNYGKFLPQALDSALAQNHDDIEVVVVNDGSSDDTEEVLKAYEGREGLKIVTLDGVGLAEASNRGIEESSGRYIVRLDADDWFDENLVTVLANFLDKHPNVGMVFCDYYTVDIHGEIIDGVRRNKVNDEVKLLDRPCLAAGAMYRRRCWETIGGYKGAMGYQEDYDFWIKFIEKFTVRNVSLPLMYYRQHGKSMSRAWNRRMDARRQIKEKFVKENRDRFSQKILAVIPGRGDLLNDQKVPMLKLGKQTLLERSIQKLNNIDLIERTIVSTDDPQIAAHAEEAGAEIPFLRSKAFNNPSVAFETVVEDLLTRLADDESYEPDIIMLLHPHSPFIDSAHIIEAIDTMLLYDCDSVIGVVEDLTYHWRAGTTGLTSVGYQKRVVRQEKDVVFKEAGGLYVFKVKPFLLKKDMLGKRIGHIELAPYEAVRIQSRFEYWLAERMAEDKAEWQTF